MRYVVLLCALFAGCAGFDSALDYGKLAVEVAAAGDFVQKDTADALRVAVNAASVASLDAQGKADKAVEAAEKTQEAVQKVDENSELGKWLAILAAAGVAARGVPSKGPVRAVMDALTPKKSSPPA